LTAWRPKAPGAGSSTRRCGTSSKRRGRTLREQLKAGYRANAERDLAIAAEWFPLEEEAWRTFEAAREPKKTTKTKRT
jgi:hypothetical protein